ncbi:hypothetical protein ACVW0J_000104 [Bradyrhizobium sp. i1.7.7]
MAFPLPRFALGLFFFVGKHLSVSEHGRDATKAEQHAVGICTEPVADPGNDVFDIQVIL